MLNVIDEFTSQALETEVNHSLDADQVDPVLDRLAVERGSAPVYVRFDNGSKFVAHAVVDWCRFHETRDVLFTPDSPWRKAQIDSVHGRLRDELFDS